MTNSNLHVVMNDVNYFLAESAEGRHFVEGFELLIPPATQVVRGDESQLRPDLLRWNWTDWSGGAGQHKWVAEQASRYYDSVGVDAWTRPGFLMTSPYLVATKNSGGSVDISFATTDPVHVIPAPGGASALIHQDDIYLWSTDRWAAASLITGVTGNVHDVDSDERYLWMVDNNSIIRRDAAGTYVDFATDVAAGDDQNKSIISGRSNVYVIYHNTSGITVVEYIKSDTPPVVGTTIYTGTQFISSTSRPRFRVCKSHNRIYIAAQRDFLRSQIIEIIPSSASGVGYGREIGDMPMVVEGLSWHAGLIYAYSKQGPQYSPEVNLGTIMYLQPLDGTYGIVDVLRRDAEGVLVSGTPNPLRGWIKGGEAVNLWFFAVQNDSTHAVLGVCDTISGALHTVGAVNALSSTIVVSGLALLPGPGITLAVEGGKVYRLVDGSFMSAVPASSGSIAPYIISPAHNFGLLEEKVLNSFRITAEDIPTNWSVQLQYEVDESGTWVTAGSITAGQETAELVLSSPAVFRVLHLRMNFVYTGGVPATTTPVISSVEAWATLARFLHTWTLLLDMSSSRSHTGGANYSGVQKLANLRTLGGTGAAFVFKDAYTRREGQTSYTVTMASCEINEIKQGEGVAAVRLVEVQ